MARPSVGLHSSRSLSRSTALLVVTPKTANAFAAATPVSAALDGRVRHLQDPTFTLRNGVPCGVQP